MPTFHALLRFGRRAAAMTALLPLVAGCGDSGAFDPGGECPETGQAGLVAALSCAPTHGAVEGRVVDSSTGDGIVGAVVATSPATGTALTGSDGRFEIQGIELGEGPVALSVTAARAGYASDSRSVTLDPGSPRVSVELGLNPGPGPPPIQGGTLNVLVRHRGSGFGGASVELFDASGASLETATTDANGFALFGGLVAGAYTVRATATIAERPFHAVGGASVSAGSTPFVQLDLRQEF